MRFWTNTSTFDWIPNLSCNAHHIFNASLHTTAFILIPIRTKRTFLRSTSHTLTSLLTLNETWLTVFLCTITLTCFLIEKMIHCAFCHDTTLASTNWVIKPLILKIVPAWTFANALALACISVVEGSPIT